jgi:hypothetical protein
MKLIRGAPAPAEAAAAATDAVTTGDHGHCVVPGCDDLAFCEGGKRRVLKKDANEQVPGKFMCGAHYQQMLKNGTNVIWVRCAVCWVGDTVSGSWHSDPSSSGATAATFAAAAALAALATSACSASGDAPGAPPAAGGGRAPPGAAAAPGGGGAASV